jgi:predicted ester cyclase
MGIPPPGKHVKVCGVAIEAITGRRFAESRIIMDTIGLLQQLGAIPTPQGGQ